MTRRADWMVTVVLGVVGGAYLYFGYLPVNRKIDELRHELSSKRQYVGQDTGLKGSIASTEQNLAETKRYVDQWKQRSPALGDMTPVFAAITLCAKKSGSRLDTFDPQPVEDYHSLRKVPLRIGVHGTFAQVHELLRGLEELPETIWVENLKMEGTRETGKPLHAEINLAVFAGNLEISD